MNNFFIALILILNINLLQAALPFNARITNIVMPDGKSGRVYEHTAIVTLKPELKETVDQMKVFAQMGALVYSRMLPTEASVTYHINDSGYLASHKNYDISKAVKCEEILLNTFIIDYSGSELPDKFCEKLIENNSNVRYAKPYFVDKLQSYTPNDPHIPDQSRKFDIIHAYDAWGVTKGDSNVVIGISDNGVQQDHEDLAPNIAVNTGEIPGDGIDNDSNGYIDDYIGYNLAGAEEGNSWGNTYNGSENHGCIVTGLADARTDNGKGIAGVGFNCKFFPIKIAHDTDLPYGYQSIIYAAVRGCKVLNMSWGDVKTFDELDQVMIDYAVSRDVALVAAGGNIVQGVSFSDSFFPAGYFGVLGVGESTNTDLRSSGSVIGAPVAIMAPSLGIFSTSFHNDYTNESGGTSFASPMVTGAVALVRSVFPNLSAIQSLQQVRLTADPIYGKESTYPQLIPGRLNVYRAVTEDPFQKPALLPIKYIYYTNSGDTTKRYQAGDTINMSIILHNYLGSAEDLTFTLGYGLPTDNFKILDSTAQVAVSVSGEDVEISGFKIYVAATSYDQSILRIDIDAKGGFHDFFKFNFTPSSHVQDFSNGTISFSASDDGSFGYSSDGKQGLGFILKGYGNQLYRRSGLMVVNDSNAVMYNDQKSFHFDFASIKGFFPPDTYFNILNDSRSSFRIGVQVETTVSFDQKFPNAAKLKLKMTNVGNHAMINPAIGYNFDFDVAGEPDSNTVSLLNDALPPGLIGTGNAAAEMAQFSDTYPVFGAASYSSYPGATAQAAGLNYDITEYFIPNDRVKALTSGTGWQMGNKADVTIISGMKFPGSIAPDDTLVCYICIGGAKNKAELAENLKNCILSEIPVGVVENSVENIDDFQIYPNPADDFVRIISRNRQLESLKAELYDITGNLADSGEFISGSLVFQTGNLSSGMYLVRITHGTETIFKTILVNR